MTITQVPAGQWREALAATRAEGFQMLDFVTGVDRGDEVEILARVVDPVSAESRMLSTRTVHDAIASVTPVYPGAAWHERETAEMFGVRFEGLDDTRPLLLRAPVDQPPLRKSVLLTARIEREWPGSGGGRRTRPLGVPDRQQQ